jgi:hypothetical protein
MVLKASFPLATTYNRGRLLFCVLIMSHYVGYKWNKQITSAARRLPLQKAGPTVVFKKYFIGTL